MDYSGNCINGTLAPVGGLVGNVHLPTITEERVRITQDGDVRQTENGNVRLIRIYVDLEKLHGTLAEDIELDVILAETTTLHATLGNVSKMSASLTIPPVRGGIAYYGEYEVTPSTEEQVLPTSGKILSQNITINPIPSNYGQIAWNGSVLTVS